VELLPAPTRVQSEVVAQAKPPEKKVAFQRRNRVSEDDLREQLLGAEEVGLGAAGARVFGTYTSHVSHNQSVSTGKGIATADPIVMLRPDLASLSFRDGPSSILHPRAALAMDRLSRKLRIYLNTFAPRGEDGIRSMDALRIRLREDLRGKKPEWLRVEAVPTLNQMLMGEDAPTRTLLVELLSAIAENPATQALAQRAVFDLNADVRAVAVQALRGRDPEVWQPVVLKAFTYPWAPPADFAAEAILELKDESIIPDLITMLRSPAPGRPYTTPDRRVMIREVVKTNHLNNCLLCHPPAMHRQDPVVGLDPVQTIPHQMLTRNTALVQALQQSTQSTGGQHDYGNRAASIPRTTTTTSSTTRRQTNLQLITVPVPVLIRGDITFLRQDFSVSFPVPQPQLRPGAQPLALPNFLPVPPPPPPIRFDYVVRTRPVPTREQQLWKAKKEDPNPQRDAILFALRELTGKDHGRLTEEWVKAYPKAEPTVRARRLADRLVKAEVIEQLGMLQTYHDGQGKEYTWALGRAIPRMTSPTREVARLTLINRLVQMDATDLLEHMGEGNAEIRQAAFKACVRRKEPELAKDLIPLLEGDTATKQLVRDTLKQLTGTDLPDAAAWHKWMTGIAREENTQGSPGERAIRSGR
jgi:hypothetical protein